MIDAKFRGKRVDNGDWVYGYYIVTPITDENSGTEAKAGWFFLSDGVQRHCIIQNSVAFTVDPETVGRYAGIKDKQNRDIYQGDVVAYDAGDEHAIAEVSTHFGHNLLFCWRSPPELPTSVDYFGCKEELEIVGDVYNVGRE